MSTIRPWIINKLGNFQWKDCCQDVMYSVVVQVISTQESPIPGEGPHCGGSALAHDTQMRVTCNFTQEAIEEFERIQCGHSGCEFSDLARYLISLDRFRVIPVLSPDLQECVFIVRVYSFSYIGPVKLRQGIADTRMAHQHTRIFNKLKELRELWMNRRLTIVSDTESESRSNEDELSQLVKHIQEMEQAGDGREGAEERGGQEAQEMAVEGPGSSAETATKEMHRSKNLGNSPGEERRDLKCSLTTIFTIEMSAIEKMKCQQHLDCLSVRPLPSRPDGVDDPLDSLQEVLEDLPVLLYTCLPDNVPKGLPEGFYDWELEALNQKEMTASNLEDGAVVVMGTSSTIRTHDSSSQPVEEGVERLQWPPGSASLQDDLSSSCPASISADPGGTEENEIDRGRDSPQSANPLLADLRENDKNARCGGGSQAMNDSTHGGFLPADSLQTGGGVPVHDKTNDVQAVDREHPETDPKQSGVLVKDTPPNNSVVSSGSGSGEEIVVETPEVEGEVIKSGAQPESFGKREVSVSQTESGQQVVGRMEGADSCSKERNGSTDQSLSEGVDGLISGQVHREGQLLEGVAGMDPVQEARSSSGPDHSHSKEAEIKGKNSGVERAGVAENHAALLSEHAQAAKDSLSGAITGSNSLPSLAMDKGKCVEQPQAVTEMVTELTNLSDMSDLSVTAGGERSADVSVVEEGAMETQPFQVDSPEGRVHDDSLPETQPFQVDSPEEGRQAHTTQPWGGAAEGRVHDDSLLETQPFDVEEYVPPVVQGNKESREPEMTGPGGRLGEEYRKTGTSVAGASAVQGSGGPSNVEPVTSQSFRQSQAVTDSQDLPSSLLDNAFIRTQSQGTEEPTEVNVTTSTVPSLGQQERYMEEINRPTECPSTSSNSEGDIFSTCPHLSLDGDRDGAAESPEPDQEDQPTTSVHDGANNQGQSSSKQLEHERTPAKKREKDDFDLSLIFATPVSVEEINKLLDERFSPLPESLEKNRREGRSGTPRPRSRKSLVSQFVSGLRRLKCSCGENLSQDSESSQCDSCQEGSSKTGGTGGSTGDLAKEGRGEKRLQEIAVDSGTSRDPSSSARGEERKRKLDAFDGKRSEKPKRRMTEGERTAKKTKNIREELLKIIIDEHCKRKKPKYSRKKTRVTL